MANNKKILIIAPHADDEILGCGGYMMSEIEKGSDVFVLFGTVGGSDSRQDQETRLNEVKGVADFVGFDYGVIAYGEDTKLDTLPSFEIISAIDKKIAEFEPDEVFANYPSRHQDHIKMYECANAAMRLKEGYMPPFYAIYEYPFISRIDAVRGGPMYHCIDKFVIPKVQAFFKYATQVKQIPSPLNEEGIMTLARMRGLECGVRYAEMFYIQKYVR